MTTLELIVWSLVLVLGIVGSAVMSGLETGLYRVDRIATAAAASRKDASRGERALDALLRRPRETLASLLIGNNAANYFGALGISAILAGIGLGDSTAVIVNTLVLTPLLLVFGETLPKEIMRSAADKIMPRAATPVSVLTRTLTFCGVAPLLSLFASAVGRLARVPAEPALSRRDHLRSMLSAGAESVALSAQQRSLIEGVFKLEHARVEDSMRALQSNRVLTSETDLPESADPSAIYVIHGDRTTDPLIAERARTPEGEPNWSITPARMVELDDDLLRAAEVLDGAGITPALVLKDATPVGLLGIEDILTAFARLDDQPRK